LVLNPTPRRRFGVALGVILTGVTAGLIGFAGPAVAHTPKISAECKGEVTTLRVKLTDYQVSKSKVNHVKVEDNGKVLKDVDFKDKYEESFKTSAAEKHTFKVTVKAWDDPKGDRGWSFEATRNVEACVTTTTTTTTETTTTTTDSTPPSTETTTTTTDSTPPSTETTTTTTESTTSPTTVPTTTTTPAAFDDEELPNTGASIALPLGIAGVLLAGGAAALFIVRRRGKA
jgi:LPXTG-motif cell wall-anchored protein